MAHDQRYIDLEAYLDGELSPQKTEAFTAALAADADLQAELEARLADRSEFRRVLGEEIPPAYLVTELLTIEKKSTGSGKGRRFPYSRIGLALAACICLVILVPRVLRNNNGAEGPRSPITRSGQVTVVRYGEIPGETAVLETGALELRAGFSR